MRAGSIPRLVMIFPGALGDLLLALPTLRRLGARVGRAHVTLVVTEPLRGLARLAGVAAHVASLDDASSAWLFGGSMLPAWLADRPAVHAWLGAHDGALRARLAAVADPVHLLPVERGPGDRHAAVAYAGAAGIAGTRRRLATEAGLEPPASAAAGALAARVARPVLAIHRGAGARAKRWAPDAFAAVSAAWRRTGGDVIELLGPAEHGDESLAGTIAVRDWALGDVAALLGLVDAYLGNDGGVSHLAGAVGARGVVVFRATDPRRWRPLSPSLMVARGRAHAGATTPSPAHVLRLLRRVESLTSTHPGSSVRA